jgi:type III pantothenate kinase
VARTTEVDTEHQASLLAIDIGNTNIVLGLYRKRRLLCHWRLSSQRNLTPDDCYLMLAQLGARERLPLSRAIGVVICSVVPSLTMAFESMIRERFHHAPLVVTPSMDTGLVIRYADPQQLGADRLANAVAAFARWGGPTIVVDLGTATTFDVISGKGEYLGGAIAPGVETGADELFKRAARLPRVELREPERVVGVTTEESIRSGVFWGAVGQIDEIVERIGEELRERPRVVATGGLAESVARYSRTIEEWDPLLTLEGLRLLSERQRRRLKPPGKKPARRSSPA